MFLALFTPRYSVCLSDEIVAVLSNPIYFLSSSVLTNKVSYVPGEKICDWTSSG